MISRGPQIVRDGLVLYLDPANKKSYPGSGSKCIDLTQSKFNYTLYNTVYNGNSFIFNGFTSYISCDSIIQFPNSTATIISWIKRSGNQQQYDGIVFSRSSYFVGMNLQTGSQIGYIWTSSQTTWGWLSGLFVPDSVWCMCSVTVYPDRAIAYLCKSDGISSSTNNVSHTPQTIDNLRIGQDSVGGRSFTGDIGPCMIYNKALSINEVKQNFDAHRGRFGI